MGKPRTQFSRNSVDLDPLNREWLEVSVEKIRPGDIVADFGKVASVEVAESGTRLFTNVLEVKKLFAARTKVQAFVVSKA